MKRNLILTTATNYDYFQLAPFVESLRDSGFRGDIVLFYNNISEKTREKLLKENVILKKFDLLKYQKENIHIMHYRFMLYYDFLKKNFKKYNKVLISDARDVYFQKDPFDFKGGREINLFAEKTTLKDCNINSHVFEKASNKKELEKYLNENILCAGTTIGTISGIMDYLKKMSLKLNIKGELFDQGYHNYIFYSNKLKESKRFLNFNGPVLTLSRIDSSKIRYDKKGNIINKDGSVINIIHQYDRDIYLLYKFNNFQDFLKNLFILFKIKFKRGIKIVLFNFPFFGKYFKLKYHDPTRFE